MIFVPTPIVPPARGVWWVIELPDLPGVEHLALRTSRGWRVWWPVNATFGELWFDRVFYANVRYLRDATESDLERDHVPVNLSVVPRR